MKPTRLQTIGMIVVGLIVLATLVIASTALAYGVQAWNARPSATVSGSGTGSMALRPGAIRLPGSMLDSIMWNGDWNANLRAKQGGAPYTLGGDAGLFELRLSYDGTWDPEASLVAWHTAIAATPTITAAQAATVVENIITTYGGLTIAHWVYTARMQDPEATLFVSIPSNAGGVDGFAPAAGGMAGTANIFQIVSARNEGTEQVLEVKVWNEGSVGNDPQRTTLTTAGRLTFAVADPSNDSAAVWAGQIAQLLGI